MDQEIISIFTEQKFSDLEQLLKQTKLVEIISLIDKRALRGKSNLATLIRALLSGSPSTTNDGIQRRLVITKHVLKLFESNEVGVKETAEVTGILLSEMDAFPPSCLVELTNYYIDGIKNGSATSSKCLELFPKVLSAIEAKATVVVGENEMKGTDYKSHILNSLCSCRWPPEALIRIVAMLRDVSLSSDELGHVIGKTLRYLSDVDQQELPPLIFQLLLLSTKGHKKMILDGVIAHFVEQDAKHSGNQLTSEEDRDEVCDDAVNDQLHHIEGTVILHITFAVKQDQQLGREFIKYFKTNQQFSLYKVLSPFTSALALSIGRIHSFEEQIFELLKSAIMKSYRDTERQRLSFWLGDMISDKQVAAAEQILDTIKNSIVGWDHITQGLVQLGFALMDMLGSRASFGKPATVCMMPSSAHSILLTPAQATCQLGVRVLQETFRVHESAQAEIVDRLLNNIVTKTTASVSHYLELLSSTVTSSPRVLLECLPRLREAFDYLMFLPIATAEGFLMAIQPLLKLSTALQDSLVLVLRKAVFSRQVDARRVAVSGFIMLLNNLRVLSSGLSLSQQSSQSVYASSSQVQVDVHINRSDPSLNEALCFEILSTLRRSLSQQAEIRLVLYEGLINVLQSNIQLGNSIIALLSDQFRRYFEAQDDVNPPIKLDSCIVLQGDQPYVAEPLAHLLSSLCHSVLLARKFTECSSDDFDKENSNIRTGVQQLLESLIMRMTKCEPEDFELDKSADFSLLTSVGVRNSIMTSLVSGVYDVLMEYRFLTSNFELAHCNELLKLHHNYQCIADVLKEKTSSSSAAGGKKKAPSTKDAVTSGSDKSGNSKSSTDGLLSFSFLSRILTSIYSDELPGHQEGLAVLRSNIDIQRHFVSAAVSQLHLISSQGRCNGISSSNTDALVKHCSKIGCVLLKQYASSPSFSVVSSNGRTEASESTRGRVLMSLCLDGFAQATTLFCSRFSHHLGRYLHAVDQNHVTDKTVYDGAQEQELIHKHIQRLQRMTMSVLSGASGNGERPLHDAAILLGLIKQLSQLLDSNSASLADIELWLLRICKEQAVDDQTVSKAMLQQLLIVSRRRTSAVELCRDISRDIHCCLGDIDQEVEVDGNVKMFASVGVRSAASTVHIVTGHLDIEIEDIEWIVTRIKAELTENNVNIKADCTQRESAEKSICNRLGHVINAFHELLQAALPIGPCIDAVLKTVNRLYSVLTLLVKLCISTYLLKNGHMDSRFEKLVKLSAVNLTPFVYNVITYVQTSQSEQLQMECEKTKKRKKNAKFVSSSNKLRVLKETRSIPNLIYAIEQYEKYLIQLSKKSKVDLTAHLKMSTSRDFRINAVSLQAAIERDEEQSDENDDNASDNNSCDESGKETTENELCRPTKKPRTSQNQPPLVASNKCKQRLSKK